ncbi:MAG: hypothetical protein CVV61_09405, partial [Tenericutes bacterium HGW-Tenericutes-6]
MNQNPKRPDTRKKIDYKKKPDYLIMLFTIVIVIGVFLFLRDALEGQVQELTVGEIQSAAQLEHIESLEYSLIGGDNFDLVQVTGKIYDQHVQFYDDIASFERVMRIDQAQAIMDTVEAYGGTTNVVAKSGVTFWTVIINLVPIALVVV